MSNENGKQELAEGTKHDLGKLRLDLLPADALTEISRVLTFGAQKYDARNWEKGIHYGRVYGALLRHLFKFWRGEEYDDETGISHLAHAGCCILFLLSFQLRAMHEYDDRSEGETRPRKGEYDAG